MGCDLHNMQNTFTQYLQNRGQRHEANFLFSVLLSVLLIEILIVAVQLKQTNPVLSATRPTPTCSKGMSHTNSTAVYLSKADFRDQGAIAAPVDGASSGTSS